MPVFFVNFPDVLLLNYCMENGYSLVIVICISGPQQLTPFSFNWHNEEEKIEIVS